MPNIDELRDEIVTSYYDNSVMLNTAMNIEKLLADDVILYPYRNWEYAEVVSGPYVRRYFVTIIFRFEYEQMPDPEAIPVLQRFGINTAYKKVKEKVLQEEPDKDGKEQYKVEDVWYVQLEIPKKLVTDKHQEGVLSQLEEILDIEAIESVADETDNGEDQFNEFDNDEFGSDDFEDFETDDTDSPEPEGDEDE
jgi:hypothetical protein